MGRPPCCDKANVKRGSWTPEEDAKILAYVSRHGTGNWTMVPQKAGLNRCGKSCRLRWTNYLRPDLNHDSFTPEEEECILDLHRIYGSRWSHIAKQLPGRTDNDVKNFWNTKLKKKLMNMGIDPVTHKPFSQIMNELRKINGLQNNRQPNTFPTEPVLQSKPYQFGQEIPAANVMEQSDENLPGSFFCGNSSQFPDISCETFEPHFLGQASSFSSSSIAYFGSQVCSNGLSQLPEGPSSPCVSSEYIVIDPFLSANEDIKDGNEFQGIVSENNTFVSGQNFTGILQNNVNTANGNEVATTTPYQQQLPESPAKCTLNSPSAQSFVDSILARNSEMLCDFPEILEEYSHY